MPIGDDKKITDRTDYANATGYDVNMLVTYRRVRKVRAMDEEQAMEFAIARETEYAARYFNATTHIGYEIVNAEAIDATPSAVRLEKQRSKKRSSETD